MSEKKLLPCPFCGGQKVIETYHAFVPVLLCGDCGAMMTIPMANFSTSYKKILVEKWNTRKPMERIVERLEKLQEEYMYPDYDDYIAGQYDGVREALTVVLEEGGLNGQM